MNMKSNPFVEMRKIRIQKIKEMIREHGPIRHKKLLAIIAIEIGTKKKTAISYLDALQEADFIKFDGDKETWSIKE